MCNAHGIGNLTHPVIPRVLFTIHAGVADYIFNNPTPTIFGNTSTSFSFFIDIVDDLLLESEESFVLMLSTDDGFIQLQPQNTTVIIQDNDGKPG